MLRRKWLMLSALAVSLAAGYGAFTWWRISAIAACNRQCRDLSAGENWPELAGVSKKWAELEPQRASPWLYRAEAAEGLADWEQVVQYLDRVPRDDPRAIPALARKALAEFENLNRPLEGMKTCDEALLLDPRLLMAHKQTIFFCAMTLQRAEMVRRIRRAIEVRRESPESYVYLFSASWLYSAAIYRHNTHWLEADPENEMYLVARALEVYVYEVKSDLAQAADFEHIPAEEELLEWHPHNLELVAYFLNRTIAEGDVDRVRELLRAVPPEPADVDARFWRAKAWCADTDGESAQAERALRRAFELDPYWWQIHFQLHDLLRRLGRHEESARFFKMYQIAKALSNEVKALSDSIESLDVPKFCGSLLELAELVEDDELAGALRDRLSTL